MTSSQPGLGLGIFIASHNYLLICSPLLGRNTRKDDVQSECQLTAGSVVRMDNNNNETA
jgi:hypothetical protein